MDISKSLSLEKEKLILDLSHEIEHIKQEILNLERRLELKTLETANLEMKLRRNYLMKQGTDKELLFLQNKLDFTLYNNRILDNLNSVVIPYLPNEINNDLASNELGPNNKEFINKPDANHFSEEG